MRYLTYYYCQVIQVRKISNLGTTAVAQPRFLQGAGQSFLNNTAQVQ